MSHVRQLPRLAGLSLASVFGYKGAFEYSSFGDAVKSWAQEGAVAFGALLSARTASGAASTAGADTQAALAASLATIERLVNSQARASATRALLLLAVPAAASLLLRQYGWAAYGWVTENMLNEGLQRVKRVVAETGDALRLRLGQVEAAAVEASEAVGASVGELATEVREVGEAVEELKRRLPPIEEDARRSAQGVGVLCDLVASSGLLSNASETALGRLDEFTGGAVVRPPPSRPDEPLPPRRELGGPELQDAAPSFVRGMLLESATYA